MKTYKVALIGCGNIFPMHAIAIRNMPNCELVAVCDIREERALAKAKEYNCAYYTDYAQLLACEEIDVVHLLTPHYLHAPMAIAAAEAGKYILTEKPMSIATEQAELMLEASERHAVRLGVIFQTRYSASSRLVKDTLQNQLLGRILGSKCIVTWKRTNDYYSSSDWRGTWALEGGGIVINQAIHTLDLMRWFIDDEIESIDASLRTLADIEIEVENSAEGIIRFKSGVTSNFWLTSTYGMDSPVEIELICEHGIVKVVGDQATIHFHDGTTLYADGKQNASNELKGQGKDYWGVMHSAQIADFYNHLATGEPMLVDVHEALETQRMVDMIYRSGKEKCRISTGV